MHSLYNITFCFLSVNVHVSSFFVGATYCNLARPKKTSSLRTEGISEHTHGLFYLDKRVACIAAGPSTRPNHLFRV